jgi:beta-glucanase (GH16 family)
MQSKKTNDGYAGAAITTKGLMEFRYGILEARVIMGTKNGTASTYWTRSRDGGKLVNEFDLCENFGLDRISPNMHTWGEGGAYHVDHKKQIQFLKEVEPKKGEHFYDTYHYISMEWTPTIVNMYVDGNLYLSQEITTENWAAFAESTYVLFGSAAPHTNYNLWGTSKNPGNYMMEKINEYCENMYIDNVRVYQINSRQYSLRAKK